MVDSARIFRKVANSGFYYVEPQTRDNRRMDLVVTYGKQEFIIELKIWRGDKYEENGHDQQAAYLATRNMDEGYLVTFDFSKDKKVIEPQWIDWKGKRIYEVIVWSSKEKVRVFKWKHPYHFYYSQCVHLARFSIER